MKECAFPNDEHGEHDHDACIDATSKPYSVEWWGSHPDAGNDDCFVGEDYATKAEAFTDYEDVNGFPHTSAHSIAYVRMVMQAEEINITRKNPDHDPARCAREAAAAGGGTKALTQGGKNPSFALQNGLRPRIMNSMSNTTGYIHPVAFASLCGQIGDFAVVNCVFGLHDVVETRFLMKTDRIHITGTRAECAAYVAADMASSSGTLQRYKRSIA